MELTLILTIASVSILLDYCIAEGEILEFYKKLLDRYLWFQTQKPPGGGITNPCDCDRKKWKIHLYKILGGCVFCTNVWLSIGFYFIFAGDISVIGLITTVTFCHVVLRVFYRFI